MRWQQTLGTRLGPNIGRPSGPPPPVKPLRLLLVLLYVDHQMTVRRVAGGQSVYCCHHHPKNKSLSPTVGQLWSAAIKASDHRTGSDIRAVLHPIPVTFMVAGIFFVSDERSGLLTVTRWAGRGCVLR